MLVTRHPIIGIFKNANPGSWIIDSSTIAPSAAVAFHEDAKKHQLNYIDAPVTGAVPGATAGTLNFLVGAENNTVFEIVKPTL
jgi:3-hydroxyisobutyrate dehydrogenase